MTLPAHPSIEAFISAVELLPPPDNVSHYVIGDVYRTPADQEAAFDAGTSNAHYGESAHNKGTAEWRGAAVDIYPIVEGSVSNHPADYQPIATLAATMGLENLGSMLGWDWAHNQHPEWQTFPVVAVEGVYPPPRRAGGIALLVLLVLAASAAKGG